MVNKHVSQYIKLSTRTEMITAPVLRAGCEQSSSEQPSTNAASRWMKEWKGRGTNKKNLYPSLMVSVTLTAQRLRRNIISTKKNKKTLQIALVSLSASPLARGSFDPATAFFFFFFNWQQFVMRTTSTLCQLNKL